MSNPSEINRNRGSHFAAGTGNPSSEWSVAAAVKRSKLEDAESSNDASFSDESVKSDKTIENYAPKSGMRGYSSIAGGLNDISTIPVSRASTESEGPKREASPVSGFDTESEETGRSKSTSIGASSLTNVMDVEGPRTSPFSRIKESGDTARKQLMGVGLLMLREAGRCDSPGCQLLRATGMQLTGQTKRMAGTGIESNLPAIPAVHTEKRFYPEDPVTGKQNRKNPQTVIESKPANPQHPDWVRLADEVKTTEGRSILYPEDALEHSHDDEDAHLAYVQERIKGFTRHLGDYKD